MDEPKRRTETVAPSLSEGMATVYASIVSMAAIAVLLEPEEIEKYTAGQMDLSQLTALMLARIPNGGESSTVRLIRAFGIRIPPEIINQLFQSLEMDGVPVDSWLADLENRIVTLEDAVNAPYKETEER